MSSQRGGLSVFNLPVFLRNLHSLQRGHSGGRRAVSTACCSSSSRLLSQSINRRPYDLDRCVCGPPSLSQRFKSTSTRGRKSNSSSTSRSGGRNKRNPPESRSHTRKQNDSTSTGSVSGNKKQSRKMSVTGPFEKPQKQSPEQPPKRPDGWMIQKDALKRKFKEGWSPRKRLSPDAMDGVRHLHNTDPVRFSTPFLAEHFKISPEAIRRILKSKWRPSEEEAEGKRQRWQRREMRVWNQMAELGLRPQRKEYASFSDAENLKPAHELPDDVAEDDKK